MDVENNDDEIENKIFEFKTEENHIILLETMKDIFDKIPKDNFSSLLVELDLFCAM